MVFFFGFAGLLTTVALHAIVGAVLINFLRKHAEKIARMPFAAQSVVVASVACLLVFKHLVDIVMWACLLSWLDPRAFSDFEEALYFSSVTYTSLGYGDIVLDSRWRLLCGYEAIDGLVLFGVTTALLFVIFQRLWVDDANARS
ncbi:MAG: potassium channel family protein [Planctomycetota bacterium]